MTGIHKTHEVFNQPPPLSGHNLYASDRVLTEAVHREGAGWAEEELQTFGEELGRPEILALGVDANRQTPELRTHDARGYRIDEVVYHPAWHELMRRGVEAEIHALPWNRPQPGAHVARAAKHFLLTQVEPGVLCPLTMTFAAVPALRCEPEVAEVWVPRATSKVYDFGARPANEKAGTILGMAMTEKQGGSDVRANTTRAQPLAEGGSEYLLTGHKWFCSAPMSDAFLTLAQTDAGLTCFLVPRWLPDGTRNPFHIQRLKDKLGNRSNASSEIEYRDTWARRLGDEGRGIPTIIEMVQHTRLDCILGSASLARQAVAHACHHAAHRAAFGRLLKDQPLMQNVLADIALDSEAATVLAMRTTKTYDESENDEHERALRRVLTAIGKYWVTKRAPATVYEALECHGGNGFVEESVLPRIYREVPLLSIWEGSGNVICLDVLRAFAKEPETLPALLDELALARGQDRRYDSFVDTVVDSVVGELETQAVHQADARRLVENLALALQAGLLIRHSPAAVADAFCGARLAGRGGHAYGTLPGDTAFNEIVERAMPQI